MKGKQNYGKITISCTLVPYKSLSEIERLKKEADVANWELTRPAEFLCRLSVYSIYVEDMEQIYGLFPNCPRVICRVATFEASTPSADGAGDKASWDDIEVMEDIPILERMTLVMTCMSGNEEIGSMSLLARDIDNLPVDKEGYYTIFDDLRGIYHYIYHQSIYLSLISIIINLSNYLSDGNVYKGKIKITVKIDREDLDLEDATFMVFI
jgi:hypothetical protein